MKSCLPVFWCLINFISFSTANTDHFHSLSYQPQCSLSSKFRLQKDGCSMSAHQPVHPSLLIDKGAYHFQVTRVCLNGPKYKRICSRVSDSSDVFKLLNLMCAVFESMSFLMREVHGFLYITKVWCREAVKIVIFLYFVDSFKIILAATILNWSYLQFADSLFKDSVQWTEGIALWVW